MFNFSVKWVVPTQYGKSGPITPVQILALRMYYVYIENADPWDSGFIVGVSMWGANGQPNPEPGN